MSARAALDSYIETLQILAREGDDDRADAERERDEARRAKLIDAFAHELAEKIRRAWVDHDAKKRGNVCMLSALNAADFIDTKTDCEESPDEDEGLVLDGGHDFQWGDDHVQRCIRCTVPHSRWGGGLCPGPEHPFRPGEYV